MTIVGPDDYMLNDLMIRQQGKDHLIHTNDGSRLLGVWDAISQRLKFSWSTDLEEHFFEGVENIIEATDKVAGYKGK